MKMILDKGIGLHKDCGDGHMVKKCSSQCLAKDAKAEAAGCARVPSPSLDGMPWKPAKVYGRIRTSQELGS